MIELRGARRDLARVQQQIEAVRAIMLYSDYAAEERNRQRWEEELGLGSRPLEFEAFRRISVADTTPVETLTLTSPMKVILAFVSNSVASVLLGIVNAYNDMRRKHAETNTKVLQEKLKQDRIRLLREHLGKMDPDHPSVAKAVVKMIEGAGDALEQVSSIELLPPAAYPTSRYQSGVISTLLGSY
jgi:hypothetical protein